MVIAGGSENSQAEVIFVIECTAVNGAYINELKTNYIIPTLEYFHGGPLEEVGGAGGACAVYSAVVCRAADCAPAPPCYTLGPYSAPQQLLAAIDRLQLVGGRGERGACLAEALGVALTCLEELSATRRSGAEPPQRHVLLMCTSPPYPAAAAGPATAEQAAAALGERGACVSIVAPRKLPALLRLFERAGGDLVAAQARNYAKDPRHLVLLRGFSLKERPPSPAPPPAPDSTSIAPPTSDAQIQPYRPAVATVRPPFSQAPPAYQQATRPQRWMVPPQAAQRTNFAGNSALISQLAQPPYLTQQSQQSSQQGNVQGQMRAQTPAPPQSSAPLLAGPPMPLAPGAPGGPGAPQPQGTFIWSGVLEWIDKNKGPGEQQKVSKHLMCQVSANSKDTEPELKADTWPNKLLMQLLPKQLIGNIGGHYLKDSKSVLFHLQQGEALESLTKVMVSGFAGCVHFQPLQTTPQCEIKVLILLYTADKKLYLGFIPNNQATFVDRLRKVIQQQKMLNQKPGPGPSPGLPGPSAPQQHPGTFIWSGVLEWIDKNKGPGEQQKVSKHLMCQVSANSKDTEPELKADTWPNKLLMQLMPKQLIGNIGGHYLKDSKSVLFHLQQGEALESLTKVMVSGFAGCVHFQPLQTTPQCEIKVLILLYSADKKAYLGFIPNNQATFVDRLRKVIQQQKMSQMLNQKPGPGPSPGLPGPSAPQQHPQQGQVPQMMGNQVGQQGVNQVGPQGQVGPPIGGPSQVSGPAQARAHELEAARIQNLEKIQQLQHTLEAAQQQEAQYKSQMEIMSHLKQTLQVAQQQEQHYKQMQEDQRQAQQQQQMQSQLQQQMAGRGVGVPGSMVGGVGGPGGMVGGVGGPGGMVGGVGGPGGMVGAPGGMVGGLGGPGGMVGGQGPTHMPPNRHMRPHMPTNPGLRHLLQQQPQYRPGSTPRPPTSAQNSQQFDDNTFDFLQ